MYNHAWLNGLQQKIIEEVTSIEFGPVKFIGGECGNLNIGGRDGLENKVNHTLRTI